MIQRENKSSEEACNLSPLKEKSSLAASSGKHTATFPSVSLHVLADWSMCGHMEKKKATCERVCTSQRSNLSAGVRASGCNSSLRIHKRRVTRDSFLTAEGLISDCSHEAK